MDDVNDTLPIISDTILSGKIKFSGIIRLNKTYMFRRLDIRLVSKTDFMNHNIDVYFVNLPEKDPSDLGFEKVTELLKETNKMKFSDLMRYKLNGKSKRYMEI